MTSHFPSVMHILETVPAAAERLLASFAGLTPRHRQKRFVTAELTLLLITFQYGHHLPDLGGAVAGELTHGHLQEVERLADDEQNDQVWNEERAAAVFVRRVREAPDVAWRNSMLKPHLHGMGKLCRVLTEAH